MKPTDVQRKLAAILSADAKNYSGLMRENEAATVRTLSSYREVMITLVEQHRGRVVDSPGDNLLAEFASVVDAVQSAVAVQKELGARNKDLPKNRKMEFRIGINLGDVIVEGDRIYGDGVNIAARLEGLADPGGICISRTAYDQIEDKLPLGYEYLGEREVKNMPKPIRAYRVMLDSETSALKAIWKKRVRQTKRDRAPEDAPKEKPLKRSARTRVLFYRHLIVYVGVIGFLAVVNALSYNGKIWFHWPALAWGLGLFLHWFIGLRSVSSAFYKHLGVYLGVIGFLLVINMLTYGGTLWFYWPALGWGLGLFFHGVGTFFRHSRR